MTKKKTQLQEVISEAISAEQAKAMLEADRQARIQQCAEKLYEVLSKYRCELIANVSIEGSNVTSGVKLLAKD